MTIESPAILDLGTDHLPTLAELSQAEDQLRGGVALANVPTLLTQHLSVYLEALRRSQIQITPLMPDWEEVEAAADFKDPVATLLVWRKIREMTGLIMGHQVRAVPDDGPHDRERALDAWERHRESVIASTETVQPTRHIDETLDFFDDSVRIIGGALAVAKFNDCDLN